MRKLGFKTWKLQKNYFLTRKTTVSPQLTFKKIFFLILWILLYPVIKKLNRPNEPKRVKKTKMSQVVKRQKIQNRQRGMKIFSRGIFCRRFWIWTQNWQKFCNLTRGRQFVDFWYFRDDSSDHSQTLPDYRVRHSHQKSRKKLAIIMVIWP